MQTQMPQIGQQNQQQVRMPEPPTVITTKDLAYLQDALSWELDVIKKLNHFAQETQCAQSRNMMLQACKLHEKHYHMLLKHLNPINSAAQLPQF